MARQSDRKLDIVRAAARLFRRHGYANTGLSEILADAEAPKGSLYHYFPGGKEDIGIAAISYSNAHIVKRMQLAFDETPDGPAMMRRVARGFAAWLEETDFTEGCAIATTVLEVTPASRRIRESGRDVYRGWRQIIATKLEADGLSSDDARRLAALSLSTVLGGLIIARVETDVTPLIEAGEEAARRIETVVANRRTN